MRAEWGVTDAHCDICFEHKRVVMYSKPDRMYGGTRDSFICRTCLVIILTGYDLINLDLL